MTTRFYASKELAARIDELRTSVEETQAATLKVPASFLFVAVPKCTNDT
jgi:hypothetical protein